MSAAVSVSLSWGTWLSGPPPMSRAGAVIERRPAQAAGSPWLSWVRMAITAGQSKSSGPAGRSGMTSSRRSAGGASSTISRPTRSGRLMATR